MCAISTSPVATPAGRSTETVVAAVVLVPVAEDRAVTAAVPPGAASTVIVAVAAAPVPAAFEGTIRTGYCPGAEEVCAGVRSVEGVPSPNSQAQEVGLPVEVSVNATSTGATPEVADGVNEETGAADTAPSDTSACQ